MCQGVLNDVSNVDSLLWVSFISELCFMSVKVAEVLFLHLTPYLFTYHYYYYQFLALLLLFIILRLKILYHQVSIFKYLCVAVLKSMPLFLWALAVFIISFTLAPSSSFTSFTSSPHAFLLILIMVVLATNWPVSSKFICIHCFSFFGIKYIFMIFILLT